MPTRPPSKCLAYRGADARHDFHPESGWCEHGCGRRQDGRHLTTDGSLIDPGPEYTPEALVTIAAALRERTTYHAPPTLSLPTA